MAGAHEKAVRTAGYGYRVSWNLFFSHGTEIESWKHVSEDIIGERVISECVCSEYFS